MAKPQTHAPLIKPTEVGLLVVYLRYKAVGVIRCELADFGIFVCSCLNSWNWLASGTHHGLSTATCYSR